MMKVSSPPSLIATPHQSPRHTPSSAASTSLVAALQLPSARTVEEIINDQSLYVDRALFFNLLQDMGTPMSEGDVTTHDPSLAKPKQKANTSHSKTPTMIIASTQLSTLCLDMFGIYCQAIESTSPSC